MSHAKGVGIGGYADSSEDFLYSRYNHYAPLSFEREVKKLETLRYFPQHVAEQALQHLVPVLSLI